MYQQNYFDVQIGYAFASGNHKCLQSNDIGRYVNAKTENDVLDSIVLSKLVSSRKHFFKGYNLYYTDVFHDVHERRTLHVSNWPTEVIRMLKKNEFTKMSVCNLVSILTSLIEKGLYSAHGPIIVTLSHLQSKSYFSFDVQNILINKRLDVTADQCTTQVRVSKNKSLKINTYLTLKKMFNEMDRSVKHLTSQNMVDIHDLVSKFVFRRPKVLDVIPREIVDFLFELLSKQLSSDRLPYNVAVPINNNKTHPVTI